MLGQRLQQLQNLRLYGHIEGRRRFVGDDEVWLGQQRHGYHQALPLSSGLLGRIL